MENHLNLYLLFSTTSRKDSKRGCDNVGRLKNQSENPISFDLNKITSADCQVSQGKVTCVTPYQIHYLASMSIKRLALTNFKNHSNLVIEPHAKWNIITGLNGQGKTNMLDGLYMSCVLKSFLNHSLQNCIRHDENFFRLEVDTLTGDRIEIGYPSGGSRKLKVNGKTIAKPSDYIGRLPVMIIQPIDDYKLLEGSQARRKIMDQAMAQMSTTYLRALMQYNRLLKQRNALLKHMRTNRNQDATQLSLYTPQLVQCAFELYDGRKRLIDNIREDLITFYSRIADNREQPQVTYDASCVPDNYEKSLQDQVSIDIAAGRTTIGPHLDDIDMQLDGHPLKQAGSQGQRKSFLVAMKLAIYQLMANDSGRMPILLLDDLFDKLDNNRVQRLLSVLQETSFGQIFITDKDDAHLSNIFATLDYPMKHVKLTAD